jgi:hypothetical protein
MFQSAIFGRPLCQQVGAVDLRTLDRPTGAHPILVVPAVQPEFAGLAMAADLTKRLWEIGDVVEEELKALRRQKKTVNFGGLGAVPARP